jgi:1,2-dihydroxy-3-keto-5-methylthiopentene dioxygenase
VGESKDKVMSMLSVYRDLSSGDGPAVPLEVTLDGERISQLLREIGVRFERWSAGRALADGASQEDILATYATEVARLSAEGGYLTADVARIARGTPNTAPIRAKFLSEHRHSEDEVRFFVEGAGSFYLHVEDRVYHVLCERNDLLSVPVDTRHWFDMGTDPMFCAIRLFVNPEGWVAQFTGDAIAARVPTHDEALSRLRAPAQPPQP